MKTLLDVDTVWEKKVGGLSPESRFAFFSALLSGLVVHLYYFVNLLLNHETSAFLYRAINLSNQGRWFLGVQEFVSGYVMAPWLKGLFCLLYLSLTAVVLCSLFQMHSRPAIFAMSALLVGWPAIASTFSYLYLADGFMLGLLLAALAVLLTRRYKWGFLPGAAVLALSLGLYQAYLAFSVLLVLFLLIMDALRSTASLRQTGLFALRSAGMGALGFVLYYVALQICLGIQGIGLSSYQNLNALGGSPFALLANGIANIPQTWRLFFDVFFRQPGFSTPSRQLFLIASALLALALLGYGIWKTGSWRVPWRMGVILGAALLVPLGACIICLPGPQLYHALMQQPLCLPCIMLAVALDKLPRRPLLPVLGRWATALLCAALFWQCLTVTNIAYANMNLQAEKAYSLTLRVVGRAEQLPDYAPGMPVVVLGAFSTEYYPNAAPMDPLIAGMMVSHNHILLDEVYILPYLQAFHNFNHPPLGENEREAFLALHPETESLPTFPAEGSIVVTDGVLVIALSHP